MSIVPRDEKLKVFKSLNKAGRPISNIATARKTNSAPDYCSDSLLKRGKRTAKKRTKNSLSAMKLISEQN